MVQSQYGWSNGFTGVHQYNINEQQIDFWTKSSGTEENERTIEIEIQVVFEVNTRRATLYTRIEKNKEKNERYTHDNRIELCVGGDAENVYRRSGSSRWCFAQAYLVFLVLPGVREAWNDGRHATGRGDLARIDHDQQLHQVVVDLAGAGLHNVHVLAAHRFANLDAMWDSWDGVIQMSSNVSHNSVQRFYNVVK